MYRKAYQLFQQLENGKIDAERTHALLESLLEQSEAVGRYDPVKFAQMALERLPGLKEGRRMAIASLVELLAFAFAEPTIEEIEKAVTKMAKLDYSQMEKFRDEGVITEHFTPSGNIFCLLKTKAKGKAALIQKVAFKKGKKIEIIPLKPENTLAEAMTVVDIMLANNE